MSRTRRRSRADRIARLAIRRAVRKVEQSAPVVWRKISPWGGSIVFHALLLLILLLIVLFSPADPNLIGDDVDTTVEGQLLDDITSLAENDVAGDPFTRLDDLQISVPVDPTELDPDMLNLPELPDTIPVADAIQNGANFDTGELSVNGPSVLEPMLGSAPAMVASMARVSPFSGRHAEARAALLRREGGTRESEAAVERGLDWLARHQAPDGRWGLDPLPFCAPSPCAPARAMQSDTAATGLALLPMLGAGHTHLKSSRYQTSIARGLNWLLTIQAPTGELFTGGNDNARMYSHAIATMALCEAYGVSGDQRLHGPAQKAVDFICFAQSPLDGGWRYQPGDPGDTSVYGWQMMCLRSAFLSGLKVPRRTINAAVAYLNAAASDRIGATYGYRPGRGASPVMTAEALLCRQYLGWKRESRAMLTGSAMVFQDLMSSGDVNIYYWYYATQMLHNMGGKAWPQWNDRVRDFLVANQVRGLGCDRGSWYPAGPQPDRWGQSAGRHFTTCLSLLTLEVYYRYLPLYRDKNKPPIEADSSETDLDPDMAEPQGTN